MRKHIWRTILACSLCLLLFYGLVGQAAADGGNYFFTQVSRAAGARWLPRTDGKTVVWTDFRNADSKHASVYGNSLLTPGEFAIATGSLDYREADVDGDIVVWEQGQPCNAYNQYYPYASFATISFNCGNRDIYAKNLRTNHTFAVANSATDEADPSISGHWVVWFTKDTAGNYALQARDISTMAPAVTLAQLSQPPTTRPAIDDTQVAWIERPQSENTDPIHWQLFATQIIQSQPKVIDEADSLPGMGPYGLDMHSNIAVYGLYIPGTDGFDLRMTNLLTYEHRAIVATLPYPSLYPTTNGRFVFWEDYQHYLYPSDKNLDLQGYDIASGSYFGISVGNGINNTPMVRGDALVWVEGSQQQGQVLVTYFNNVLPAALLPSNTQSTPDSRFFQQTGHLLSFGFKYFWEHSGGLPVFGYPLTEEFREVNPDTLKTYTVQYFERERYEYHPEFKGTPYETELGRLGVTDAQQRGLADTAAFKPITNPNNPGCVFFPTGHQACGKFLAYWQTHGLDFGDAGTSYRESLALFGYPISEPLTDPQTGLTIQYFERARLEYHPQFANTPNEIELGLLGQRVLEIRGWILVPPQ